mgnify:CR=1 FL=1
MKKIMYVLLFLIVIISIQPVVSGGRLSGRGNDDQSSAKIGFVYRNVVFEAHPLRLEYEKEIKKLQKEYEDFHKNAMNDPEMKKLMVEVQELIDELQSLEEGTDAHKKKEEEINNNKKAFSKHLEFITEKENAIVTKQREFYQRFESDLGEVATEIGKEKNISLVVSMLARGYDGHGHGNQKELTPSYNYFPYKKEGTECLDLTKEFIHKLEVMYKFRKADE